MRRQLALLYRLLLKDSLSIKSCGIDKDGIVVIVIGPKAQYETQYKIYLQPIETWEQLERKRKSCTSL